MIIKHAHFNVYESKNELYRIGFQSARPYIEHNIARFESISYMSSKLVLSLHVDADEAGEEDGEHHGPREPGGRRAVSSPPCQGANRLYI